MRPLKTPHREIRKSKILVFLLGAGFQLFLIGPSFIHAQKVPSDAVKIVIDGKQYASILEYRRQKIKSVLTRALSADDLQMFTEEDLCGIVKEIRKQQAANSTNPKPDEPENPRPDIPKDDQQGLGKSALDPGHSQKQEMSDNYQNEREGAEPVVLDPDKVRNIIIEPKMGSEGIFQD
jgi:hypothetical protein